MEFKVPQFIDIEDKIVGSLTFAQIIYIVGGGAMSYVLWTIIPNPLTFIKIPIIAAVVGLAFSLAFYPKEKHGKPFVEVLEASFKFFFLRDKLYTWKHTPKEQASVKEKPEEDLKVSISIPNISESKLKDLSWKLDIKKEINN